MNSVDVSVSARRATRFVLPLLLALAVSATGVLGSNATGRPAPAVDLADLSLEQLMEVRIEKVVSASRYAQRVTEAPAAVTIVTSEEIERFGHRTLSDVLSSVRGLYASNDNNYSYLGMRGFLRPGDYNTRVLLLIDGHRLNDNVYDSASTGEENSLDLELVERVEVVRGPSSSIYGSSAFFGVVNVVTKRGAQLQGGVVSAAAGSLGTFKGRMTVGGVTPRGVDWILSASQYVSRGQKQIYYPEYDERISSLPAATNLGVAEDWDRETAEKVYGRMSFADVAVSGFFTRRYKEVPTGSFATAFNARAQESTDQRMYVDAKYDGELSPGLRLLGRVFYDSFRYQGDFPYDVAAPGDPPETVFNKDYSTGDWIGSEVQFSARLGRHRLVTGAEFRRDLRQEQLNYDLEPYAEYANIAEKSRTLGVYAQAEVALSRRTVLNLGVRRDHYYKSFGGTTNPRFALIYRLSPQTTLKALYGQAFRAPNAYERNYFESQRRLEPLRPETIRTGELMVEQYLTRNYRFSLTAYQYKVSGLINQFTFPVTGELAFGNLDGVHATGAEIELEGRWEGGAVARLSYAHQQSEDQASGVRLSNSPDSLAKLHILVPLRRDRIFLGHEALYQGSVDTLAGRTADEFIVTNLTLTFPQFRAGWDAGLSVHNVFGTRYGYPGAGDHVQDVLPQQARTVRLKLDYRF